MKSITYKGNTHYLQRVLGWQYIFFYVSLVFPFPFLILEKEEIFPGSGVHKNTTLKALVFTVYPYISKSPPILHPSTHHFFTHPSTKYLLSTYSAPIILLDTAVISADRRNRALTHVELIS